MAKGKISQKQLKLIKEMLKKTGKNRNSIVKTFMTFYIILLSLIIGFFIFQIYVHFSYVEKLNEDKMIFNLDFSKHSARGSDKLENEDAVGYYLPQDAEDLFLRGQMFLIADGMGEKQGGEFSSKLVVQTVIQEYFEAPWNGNLVGMLKNALQKANKAIYQANINKGKQGYYSNALICAVVQETTLYLATVGDCQAYLFSNNSLEKLTQFEKLEKKPTYPLSTANGQEFHPHLLGMKEKIDVDILQRQIQINDFILLFTYSIIDAMPEQDLPKIISTTSLQQACELLVKIAIDKNVKDDATAIIFRIKGIKRLSIDEHETSSVKLQEPEAPDERQIVIKGVRYRSNRKDEPIGEPDKTSVDEFTHDRDFRRPVHKRTIPPQVKSPKFPWGKLFNFVIFFVFFFLLIYALRKYIPPYLQALKESPKVQQITPSDTLDYSIVNEQEPEVEAQDSIIAPLEEPQLEVTEDTTISTVEKEVKAPLPVSLKMAVINGSKKPISLNEFNDEVKALFSSDRLTMVKSTYRIRNSTIIWRRMYDSLKLTEISKRVEDIKIIFKRYFQIEPEVMPLDFTIVIGADFKMPIINDNYSSLPDAENNYYVEILNGFKVAGSARKLSNQLHNQLYEAKKIVIVNYRNADKLNYLHSFLKCDISMTEAGGKFINHFKLPNSIAHAPLFDIKILVGSDVQF